jgi:hypothetical protein
MHGLFGQMKQAYSQVFEQFWHAYPRRSGPHPKQAAYMSFRRVTKTTDPAIIISAARSFAKWADESKKTGTEFIPMAATWLNQCRWEDYAVGVPQPPTTERVFVEIDTPQWMAWLSVRKWPQTDHRIEGRLRRGWFFPSEWPPGYSALKEA